MTATLAKPGGKAVASLAETLAVLRASEADIRRLGATALFLYGSAARDELGPESDVDAFVDYEPDGPFSFVELFDLRELLSGVLGRSVDLTTRFGLHPRLRRRIEAQSVRVL